MDVGMQQHCSKYDGNLQTYDYMHKEFANYM